MTKNELGFVSYVESYKGDKQTMSDAMCLFNKVLQYANRFGSNNISLDLGTPNHDPAQVERALTYLLVGLTKFGGNNGVTCSVNMDKTTNRIGVLISKDKA